MTGNTISASGSLIAPDTFAAMGVGQPQASMQFGMSSTITTAPSPTPTSTAKTTRFSGADWADQIRSVMIVGAGGIGSWLTLNLSRIGHYITLVDFDGVDETNVTGGQMFRAADIGRDKVDAVRSICRDFGCNNVFHTISTPYTKEFAVDYPIILTGLDSMAPRKLVYEDWKECVAKMSPESQREAIFIDGRLTMEMYEVLTIKYSDLAAREEYERDYLFSDEEAQVLDCTTKQSTFAAMGIASEMTAILCNHLTNIKLDMDFREFPFYDRKYYPMMETKKIDIVEPVAKVAEQVPEAATIE